MYELAKEFGFDAAHTLNRAVDVEPSRRIHGHSYRAEIVLRGEPEPTSGMVMDLGALDRAIATARDGLDHHFLDEVEGLGPATLENLCTWIWHRLEPTCPALWRVTVRRDSDRSACSYFGKVRKEAAAL